jgi:hypothetical protein
VKKEGAEMVHEWVVVFQSTTTQCQHHSPALLCFDTSHEHRYGAPVYANDRKLIQNFTKISKPARPNFLYAGEACYDYEFETYHLAYHRS